MATRDAQLRLTLVDRVTGPIRRIQARMANLSRALGVQRLTTAFAGVGRAIGGLGTGLAATTRRLGMFTAAIGLGGGGAAAAALSLTRNVAAAGDEISKTSRQLGLGAEAWQEYRYAASMAGVSDGTLQSAFQRLGQTAVQAAEGAKGPAELFRRLGIRVRDANGNLKDNDRLMTEVAQAFDEIDDPMRRASVAMELFGRGNADMVRFFADGADGLRASREEARQTGHVMSQEASDFGAVYSDNLARLERRFEGLKNMIGVQLMPTMNDLVVRMREWFDANQDLIRSTITEWVGRLSDAIEAALDPASEFRQSLTSIVDGVTGFLEAVRPLVDFLGGPMHAGFLLIGAYIGAPLLTAIATLGTAFAKLGLVMLTTPIGWILIGIGSLVGIVALIISRWDDFAAYWEGVWGRIKGALGNGLTGILVLFEELNPFTHIARGLVWLVSYLTGVNLDEVGSALIRGFWQGMVSMWDGVVSWVRDAVNGLLDFMPDWVKQQLGIEVTARPLTDAELNAAAYKAGSAAEEAVQRPGWFASAEDHAAHEEARRIAFRDASQAELRRLRDENERIRAEQGAAIAVPAAPALAAGAAARVTLPAFNPPTVPTLPAAPSARLPDPDEIRAGSVNADSLNVPEPLVVHEPQEVSADIHVHGGINITAPPGTDERAIASAVTRALEEQARRQRDAIRSALND